MLSKRKFRADPPASVRTPATQERKVEYTWNICSSDLALLSRSNKAIQSPSFFVRLDDCLHEWKIAVLVAPQETAVNVGNRNYDANSRNGNIRILLKLVSNQSYNYNRVKTEFAVRYEFELRFPNLEVSKSGVMETPESFSVGHTGGVKSICELERLRNNCVPPFASRNSRYGYSATAHMELKLHCVLWIQDDDVSKIKSASEVLDDYVATRQFQSLTTFMRSMLMDGTSADITLKVGNKAYPAHIHMLSARSKVFAAMFGSGMKEARNRTVEIKDFEPEIVQAMLQYIYWGDITAAKDKPYDLLKIADKYELLELKDECEKFIVPSLTVANAAEALMCAYEHNLKSSLPGIKNFVNGNRAAISKTDSFKEAMKRYPKMLFDLFSSEEKVN